MFSYNQLSAKVWEVTLSGKTVVVEYTGNDPANELAFIALERLEQLEYADLMTEFDQKVRLFGELDDEVED